MTVLFEKKILYILGTFEFILGELITSTEDWPGGLAKMKTWTHKPYSFRNCDKCKK